MTRWIPVEDFSPPTERGYLHAIIENPAGVRVTLERTPNGIWWIAGKAAPLARHLSAWRGSQIVVMDEPQSTSGIEA